MALRRSRWEDEIGRMSVGATKAGCPACHWLGRSPSATSLLQPSAVVVWATVVGVAGRCLNRARIGVRDMLSYQSPIPAGAGTPRYENRGALVDGRVQVSSVPRTPPLAGDKPQRYIPLSTLGCRCWVTVVGVAGRRRGSFIFVPTLGKCVDPGPTRHIQFPRPPLSLVLSPHGRRYGYGQARNRVSL